MRRSQTCRLLACALLIGACSDDNDDPDTTTDAGSVETRDAGDSRDSGSSGDGEDESDDAGSGATDGGRGAESLDGGTSADSGDDATSSSSDGGASSDGGTSDSGTSDAGDAAPAPDLTDPQIGAVTTAANTGEVAQANAALPKLSSPPIKGFAMKMVSMHSAAQTRQAALLQRKGITPEDNEISTQLKQESDQIVAALMGASAADVDKLYIDDQVKVHTEVLDTLTTVLIPSAEDPDLRNELVATRADVQSHLTEAKQLQAALSAP